MHWKLKKSCDPLHCGVWNQILSISKVCLYMIKLKNDGVGQADIVQFGFYACDEV